MADYFKVRVHEMDLSLRQQGFNVISGSGEFICSTINSDSGSIWYELKAINDDAVVVAKSLRGEDLSADGLGYDTGANVTITKDTSVLGAFTHVTIDSGIILAYKG